MTHHALPAGLYERLVTRALDQELLQAREVQREPLDAAGRQLVVDHVANALARVLDSLPADQAATVGAQLANGILAGLAERGRAGEADSGDGLVLPPEVLMGIGGRSDGVSYSSFPPRPSIPLTADALLVNAPHEPQLASELRSELGSADSVDLLCAFIVWSGLRTLLPELRALTRRGGRLRVVTTTYTGTTDPRALDELARIGAEIRVSYDTRTTRLHAKSWLFHRDSGFSTVYVGSSNLTHSAIHAGLEWNVRLTQARSPRLFERFTAAFETYWADPHLAAYDPVVFRAAVSRDRTDTAIDFTPFDVVPFEYQRIMLDQLLVERDRHDRWNNLVVAATGTGKTIVAALDYARMAKTWGGDVSLLFVAHRQEILEQSRTVFRHVLRDGSFGELLVGGERPAEGRHIFASIQSLARLDLSSMAPNRFAFVVIDEFHHAEAPTYRRLLEHIEPRVLLGLTATPERADMKDLLHWFGGRIAVELRLWDALAQGLLCPFQYFGVSDGVDLTHVEWRRGGYDAAQLDGLYTGNDARVAKVLQSLGEWVSEPHSMRAIGFCVGVDHARYMAEKFNAAGSPRLP